MYVDASGADGGWDWEGLGRVQESGVGGKRSRTEVFGDDEADKRNLIVVEKW